MPRSGALWLLLCALGSLPAAHAQDFVDLDPRVLAMGGTGIAWGPPYEAGFLNPALIAPSMQSAHPAFIHAYGGLRFIDRAHLREALRNYHDHDDQAALSAALAAVNAKLDAHQLPTKAELDAVRDDAERLIADLSILPNEPMEVQADDGATAGMTDKDASIAAFVRQRYLGGAVLNLTNHDQQVLEETLAQLRTLVDKAKAGAPLSSLKLPDPAQQLTSSFTLKGAVITEQGLDWGTALQGPHTRLAWGISLKAMRFEGVVFDATVENARRSQFNFADNSHTWTFPDADAGVVVARGAWSAGIVADNLFAHRFAIPNDHVIDLDTTVRGGAAYHRAGWTLAADVDLTANQPYGFVARRRNLGLGMQYAFADGFDLRAGWQTNLVNGENLPSAGAGWDGRFGQVDFAVAHRGDDYAAALDVGMMF